MAGCHSFCFFHILDYGWWDDINDDDDDNDADDDDDEEDLCSDGGWGGRGKAAGPGEPALPGGNAPQSGAHQGYFPTSALSGSRLTGFRLVGTGCGGGG